MVIARSKQQRIHRIRWSILVAILVSLFAGCGNEPHDVITPTSPPPVVIERAVFPSPPQWKPDDEQEEEGARELSLETVANHTGLLILTKKDADYRDNMRAAGYTGLVLEYFIADSVDGPQAANRPGMGCDDSAFIPWSNQLAYNPGDFCERMHPNEDWFLHNGKGERLYQQGTDRNFYAMNPANKAWRAFVIERLRQEGEENAHQDPAGYDGFFLDAIPLSLEKVQKKLTTSDGVVREFSSDAHYRAAWQTFLQEISDALRPRWPVWANLVSDPLDGQSANRYLPYLDGVASELFATGWIGQEFTPDEWQATLTHAEQVLANGKGFLAQSQGSDATLQPFALASYLLIASGNQTFFRYSERARYDTWNTYTNEQVALGIPLGPRYHLGAGLWRRDFTAGYVVVDPIARVGTIVAGDGMKNQEHPRTILQSFFYRPPTDGTPSWEVANRADLLILTKQDEQFRLAVKHAGYEGLVLQYVVASEVEGPATAISSNAPCAHPSTHRPWNNQVAYEPDDFCQMIHPNEDWFLHNGKGERLYTDIREGPRFYHMNPGNVEWQAFVVSRLLRFLEGDGITEAMGYDGIFLDNVELSLMKAREQCDNSDGVIREYTTETSFQEAWQTYLRTLSDALRPQWPLWANLVSDPLDGRSWWSYMAYLDGMMNEAFATGWPWSSPASPDEWEMMMRQAERTLTGGKGYIAQSQGIDDTLQPFALASYLLITNNQQAFFRYSIKTNYREWKNYPNYATDLGAPLGPRYRDETGAWRRDFQRGFVLVHPDEQSSQIVITTSYRSERSGMIPTNAIL